VEAEGRRRKGANDERRRTVNKMEGVCMGRCGKKKCRTNRILISMRSVDAQILVDLSNENE